MRLRYTLPPPGRSRHAMSPLFRRSRSADDMKKSSCAFSIGTISCSTRKVFSISRSRPCQSGTRVSVMMRSARSNATPARARCSSACICAITWSVTYMKRTNAAVAGSIRKR